VDQTPKLLQQAIDLLECYRDNYADIAGRTSGGEPQGGEPQGANLSGGEPQQGDLGKMAILLRANRNPGHLSGADLGPLSVCAPIQVTPSRGEPQRDRPHRGGPHRCGPHRGNLTGRLSKAILSRRSILSATSYRGPTYGAKPQGRTSIVAYPHIQATASAGEPPHGDPHQGRAAHGEPQAVGTTSAGPTSAREPPRSDLIERTSGCGDLTGASLVGADT